MAARGGLIPPAGFPPPGERQAEGAGGDNGAEHAVPGQRDVPDQQPGHRLPPATGPAGGRAAEGRGRRRLRGPGGTILRPALMHFGVWVLRRGVGSGKGSLGSSRGLKTLLPHGLKSPSALPLASPCSESARPSPWVVVEGTQHVGGGESAWGWEAGLRGVLPVWALANPRGEDHRNCLGNLRGIEVE